MMGWDFLTAVEHFPFTMTVERTLRIRGLPT